jgi:hypothetical protein
VIEVNGQREIVAAPFRRSGDIALDRQRMNRLDIAALENPIAPAERGQAHSIVVPETTNEEFSRSMKSTG